MPFSLLLVLCFLHTASATSAQLCWSRATASYHGMAANLNSAYSTALQLAQSAFVGAAERSPVWQTVDPRPLDRMDFADTIAEYSGQVQPFVNVGTAEEFDRLAAIVAKFNGTATDVSLSSLTSQDVHVLSIFGIKYCNARRLTQAALVALPGRLSVAVWRVSLLCGTLKTRPDLFESDRAARAWVERCAEALRAVEDWISDALELLWRKALLDEDCAFLDTSYKIAWIVVHAMREESAFEAISALKVNPQIPVDGTASGDTAAVEPLQLKQMPAVDAKDFITFLSLAKQTETEVLAIARERVDTLNLVMMVNEFEKTLQSTAVDYVRLFMMRVNSALNYDMLTFQSPQLDGSNGGPSATDLDSWTVKISQDLLRIYENVTPCVETHKLTELAFTLRSTLMHLFPSALISKTQPSVTIPPLFHCNSSENASNFLEPSAKLFTTSFNPSSHHDMRQWSKEIDEAVTNVGNTARRDSTGILTAELIAVDYAYSIFDAVQSYGAGQLAALDTIWQTLQAQ